MTIDINVISENLAELLTSVVNTATKFYDIFVNPIAKTVNIQVFDNNNKLVTQTIPNLAMSRQPLQGQVDPEGNVYASKGQFYVNTLNSTLFVKIGGTNGSATGWQQVVISGAMQEAIKNLLPLESISTLNASGTMELADNKSYKMNASGSFSYTLPIISSSALNTSHRIHIQLSLPSEHGYTISLGTLYYEPCDYNLAYTSGSDTYSLVTKTPLQTLEAGGLFNIDYEYDTNGEVWVCKVQKKTNVW